MLGKLITAIDQMGLTRRRVNALIGGAQRCGTTTLHSLCELHPLIVTGSRKEIGFFHRTPAYERGRGWYHSHFPARWNIEKSQVILDATPDYLLCPRCPRRIHDYNPEMKMIFTFRDPVERAFSHWNLFRRLITTRNPVILRNLSLSHPDIQRKMLPLVEKAACPDFQELVEWELEDLAKGGGDEQVFPSVLRRGLYGSQIGRWLEWFPRSQIHLINLSDLVTDASLTMKGIWDFLGVPQGSVERNARNANPEQYVAGLPDDFRKKLDDFFRADKERLFELTGFVVK